MAGLQLPFSYDPTNPVHVDQRKGANGTYWASITAAKAGVPKALRPFGLTVNVMVEGKIVEYWWQNGIEDADLVLKAPAVNEVVAPTEQVTKPKIRYNSDTLIWEYSNDGLSFVSFSSVQEATEQLAGILRRATADEAAAGVNDTTAMSPAKVKSVVTAAINALIGAAPGSLNALDELSNALGNDPNFAATVTALIGGKVAIADIIDNLTTNVANKPLSAKQGLVLKGLIDGLTTSLTTKADLVGGKVPASQLPVAVTGAVTKKGSFDASTGQAIPTGGTTAALPAAAPANKGDYYIVTVGGTFQAIPYDIGDWIVSDGASYGKVDNTDTIKSVLGLVGTIPAATQAENEAQTSTTTLVTPRGMGYFWTYVNKLTGFDALLAGAITTADTFVSALSKLQRQMNAKLDKTLATGQLIIGDLSNTGVARALSGDITISYLGVAAIGALKVLTSMLASNAVTNAKLAQMPNLTVKGNLSGATADPSDYAVLNIWEGGQAQFFDNERGVNRWASGVIFKQMVDTTVANSTVETSLMSATNQIGTNVLLAGVAYVGDTFIIESKGFFSSAGSDALEIKVKLGAMVIATTAQTVYGPISNASYHLSVEFTVRSLGATGTITATGILLSDGTAIDLVNTAPVTIDFTSSKTLDITATWNAALAGNTITSQQAKIVIL